MLKSLYKWHRVCSLIIALPVVLWAASGLMHPIMTNIRPAIASQELNAVPIDSNKIKIPLSVALRNYDLKTFQQVRLVSFDTSWYYQVRVDESNINYINTSDGKRLENGDQLYAQHIARKFLEGDDNANHHNHEAHHHESYASSTFKKGARVISIEQVTSFNHEYASINRLLPVYKVSFDRKDGIAIYVETSQSRFSFATNAKRSTFSNLFTLVHTWRWLEFFGKGKLIVEIFFSALAFVTAILGIVIFFGSKGIKANHNTIVRARRNHRYTAIVVSLFTLMFSFSGCYHAISKWSGEATAMPTENQNYSSDKIHFDFIQLRKAVDKNISNVQLATIGDSIYWRVSTTNEITNSSKDLMKDQQVSTPTLFYVNANNNTLLKNGDEQYARQLAEFFNKGKSIQSTELITHFDNNYNFADKLLPVWKVAVKSELNEQYFIETTSGKLSKKLDDNGSYESLSFSLLHKHEFLSPFGKGVKDFSTMFWATSQIVIVAIGFVLYLKLKAKK